MTKPLPISCLTPEDQERFRQLAADSFWFAKPVHDLFLTDKDPHPFPAPPPPFLVGMALAALQEEEVFRTALAGHQPDLLEYLTKLNAWCQDPEQGVEAFMVLDHEMMTGERWQALRTLFSGEVPEVPVAAQNAPEADEQINPPETAVKLTFQSIGEDTLYGFWKEHPHLIEEIFATIPKVDLVNHDADQIRQWLWGLARASMLTCGEKNNIIGQLPKTSRKQIRQSILIFKEEKERLANLDGNNFQKYIISRGLKYVDSNFTFIRRLETDFTQVANNFYQYYAVDRAIRYWDVTVGRQLLAQENPREEELFFHIEQGVQLHKIAGGTAADIPADLVKDLPPAWLPLWLTLIDLEFPAREHSPPSPEKLAQLVGINPILGNYLASKRHFIFGQEAADENSAKEFAFQALWAVPSQQCSLAILFQHYLRCCLMAGSYDHAMAYLDPLLASFRRHGMAGPDELRLLHGLLRLLLEDEFADSGPVKTLLNVMAGLEQNSEISSSPLVAFLEEMQGLQERLAPVTAGSSGQLSRNLAAFTKTTDSQGAEAYIQQMLNEHQTSSPYHTYAIWSFWLNWLANNALLAGRQSEMEAHFGSKNDAGSRLLWIEYRSLLGWQQISQVQKIAHKFADWYYFIPEFQSSLFRSYHGVVTMRVYPPKIIHALRRIMAGNQPALVVYWVGEFIRWDNHESHLGIYPSNLKARGVV